MLAVLTAPDALVIAAVVTGVSGASWWQSRRNGRQMKPNAGKTMRDAVDRIEADAAHTRTVVTELGPRLDHHAVVIAALADRVAVVEAIDLGASNERRLHTLEANSAVIAAALQKQP